MKTCLLLWVVFAAFVPDVRAGAVDKDKFYERCKPAFPKHVFSGKSREGFEHIFGYWEKTEHTDPRWLAYILGTAYRETAGMMQPVREGLCKSDACSIRAVTQLVNKRNVERNIKKKKLMANYALPDEHGRSYFGRGYVQLSLKENYQTMSKTMGWKDELVGNPGLVLDPERSVAILVEGMTRGLFTKRALKDDFNEHREDWITARKIVNPYSSRAEITAAHGKAFYACLQ
ncbi:hypothetical protein G4G28_03580 [Massilia sp. Dwa41.01b]|uniref:glycoside hydrolase family 19 protein n=1 Tax=unclassified Massilia TaxID=2609279 RepID=UPI001603D453|nr:MULTISPECIES: glycoside hydrolase family 19 protein [unclassified Massilia]QNA87781.1 hypothetical protein G4G28_03580 [Massilia sp. Dwa41.01b]QNA98684.1 hypothetical protein G4G31_07300 [Massilia sp. Se16.2.3]